METIKINLGRTLCVDRNTAQEKFYQVDLGGDNVRLQAGNNQPIYRKAFDLNGFRAFKFKGNIYQTDSTAIVIRGRK